MTVDTLVVGRGVGVDALATLGGGGLADLVGAQCDYGLVQGFSLLVASGLGPKTRKGCTGRWR